MRGLLKVVALPTNMSEDGNEALNKPHFDEIVRFNQMKEKAQADHA